MFDRVDWITASLYVVAMSLLVVPILVYGPAVLSSSSPGIAFQFLILAVGFFIFAYPAYWAFNIRKALAVRLYRKQALGIGLVSLAYIAGAFDPTGTAYAFFLILVFYWIDASYSATRRSDPLLRDSLLWSRLRIFIWVIVTAVFSVTTVANVIGIFGTNPISSGFGAILYAIPFFLIAASGVALGAVASRRSTDAALKGHLVWFGLFVFAQMADILLAQINSLGGFTYYLGFAFAGFFLYKSAKSLVPLNRLESIQVNPLASIDLGAVPSPKPPLGRTY